MSTDFIKKLRKNYQTSYDAMRLKENISNLAEQFISEKLLEKSSELENYYSFPLHELSKYKNISRYTKKTNDFSEHGAFFKAVHNIIDNFCKENDLNYEYTIDSESQEVDVTISYATKHKK